jgi:hypothetical protein
MYGWRQFEFGSFINHDAQAQCSFGNQAYSRLIATSVNTWGVAGLWVQRLPPELAAVNEFAGVRAERFSA